MMQLLGPRKTYYNNINVETERLILRNLTLNDADDVFKWCSDPQVTKYVSFTTYNNTQEVIEYLKWVVSENDNPDHFIAGVVTKSTNELIGSCTICYEKDRDIWSIGYTFKREAWGHGYATEAMQGLIDYIKKFRTMRGIEGCVVSENPGSQRVLEKLGMTFLEDVTLSKIDGSQTFKGKKFQRIF